MPDEVSFEKPDDHKGNDPASKTELKFHRKWKESSDWKDDLPRYLTAAAEAVAEPKRNEEKEARTKAENEARNAATVKQRKAEEETRQKR